MLQSDDSDELLSFPAVPKLTLLSIFRVSDTTLCFHACYLHVYTYLPSQEEAGAPVRYM